jgi:hypothetical protein
MYTQFDHFSYPDLPNPPANVVCPSLQLPEEPNRFSENAPDLEGADLVAPGKALATFVGFLVALGGAATALSFVIPDRPYVRATIIFNLPHSRNEIF